MDEPKNIKFCTYAGFMNISEGKINEIKHDLAVWDECHRAGARMRQLDVQRFLKLFPDVPILGFTATAIMRDMSEELSDDYIKSGIKTKLLP